MSFVGRSVPRLEDRPLVTRPRALRGRCRVSAHAAHARRALGPRAWPHRVDRHERGAGAAGRRRGLDLRRRRRHSADRFPADPHRGLVALPPDHPGAAARALCRRAGRGRVRDRSPIWRRTPPTSSHVEIDELPVILDASATPGEFDDGRSTEPAIVEKSYGDVAAALRDAHAVVELDLAVGRHSGVPMETRGAIARYDAANDVLEMHGAAKVPHWNRDNIARMLGRDPSTVHLYRGPCRRRLRHPRRALSRGRAGLRRRAAARPAGEMDRGPARAPDRRQSFAPAAAQGARRGRRGRAHSRPSTTNSSTTRAATCAPTRPRCPISRPRCCRVPIGCRPIGRSVMSGSPTRRRAAPIARPAGTRARSCASA